MSSDLKDVLDCKYFDDEPDDYAVAQVSRQWTRMRIRRGCQW